MSVAICTRCHHSANASFCPKCQGAMNFDELELVTRDVRRMAAKHRLEQWKKRKEIERIERGEPPAPGAKVILSWAEEQAIRRRGPLDRDAIRFITEDVTRSLEWCRESREAKHLRLALETALLEVGRIEQRRKSV